MFSSTDGRVEEKRSYPGASEREVGKESFMDTERCAVFFWCTLINCLFWD